MMLTVEQLPSINSEFERKIHQQKTFESNNNNHINSKVTNTNNLNAHQTNIFSEDVVYSKNRDICETLSVVSTVDSSRNSPFLYDLQNQKHFERHHQHEPSSSVAAQYHYNNPTHNNSNYIQTSDSEFYYDTDTQQSRSTKPRKYNYTDRERINQDNLVLQNLDQSNNYMHSDYTTKIITTSGKSNINSQNSDIPYHARKDSQPFTYGNISASSDSSMIRTPHSGLSSPSMVRKASFRSDSSNASTLTNLKKTPTHDIDFEDMFHENYEKKYSFGDKITNNHQDFKSILNNKNDYGIKNENYRTKTYTYEKKFQNNNNDFNNDLKYHQNNNSMSCNSSASNNIEDMIDCSGYSSDW